VRAVRNILEKIVTARGMDGSHMASEGFIPFEGAEVHICINMERINIKRRNNEKSPTQAYPSDSQNTPVPLRNNRS
jgi:hypothetical protein